MHRTRPINFDWRYVPRFKSDYLARDYDDSAWDIAHIPHTNIELPFNNFSEDDYQFESCYRKHIEFDAISPETVVFARFEGVMACARVFLNGRLVGEHRGGYTPFRVDLTSAIETDSPNVLAVQVDSRARDDIPPSETLWVI